jgi:hypothetical protein
MKTRQTALLAGGAISLSLLAGCGASQTFVVGGCSGNLMLAVDKGLMVATAKSVCAGTPPAAYTISIVIYADGMPVHAASSSVVPDSTGYSISAEVVCTVARYKADAETVIRSPDGTVRYKRVVVRVNIKNQSDCH